MIAEFGDNIDKKTLDEHLKIIGYLSKNECDELLVNYVPKMLRAVETFKKTKSNRPKEEEELLHAACAVLRKLFDTASASPDSLTTLQQEFLIVLRDGPDSLRSVVLGWISKMLKENLDLASQKLCGDFVALLVEMVRLLSSPETSTRTECTDVFSQIVASPRGAEYLFESQQIFITELRSCLGSGDASARFRIHDLTVKLSLNGAFSKCREAGLLDSLANELEVHDDVLVRLNALELLADFSSQCFDALEYLHKIRVLDRLADLLSKNDDSNMDWAFLRTGIIRFFGYIGHSFPNIISEYPDFIETLFVLCSDSDSRLALLSMETISLISASNEGKTLFQSPDYSEIFRQYLHLLGSKIAIKSEVSSPQLTECAKRVCQVQKNDNEMIDEHIMTLTEANFREIFPNGIGVLGSMFKSPVPELHISAGDLFKSLSNQAWFQQILMAEAGLIESILDRNLKTTPDGMYMKYDIICALLDSPTTRAIVPAPVYVRMAQYRNQGVHFVQRESEVAYEGTN